MNTAPQFDCRLYTSYLFHREGDSAAMFHHDVLIATAMMDHCMATTKDRIECFFNESFTSQMPVNGACYTELVSLLCALSVLLSRVIFVLFSNYILFRDLLYILKLF